jgi:hypothetical protein
MCSRMMKLERGFPHVGMGSSAQQLVVVIIASKLPQFEGTDELGGLLCKGYMDTSTSSSPFSPRQHC